MQKEKNLFNGDKFMSYELSKIPEPVIKIIGEEKLKENMKSMIKKISEQIDNDISANKYMEYSDHHNKYLEDYRMHLTHFGESHSVVSRISFREDENGKKPLINIIMKNFDFLNFMDTDEFLKSIYGKYKNFNPVFLRFFEFSEKDADNKFITEDNFVIGHVKSIQKNRKPLKYNEVSLEKMNDLSFYDKYFEEHILAKTEITMFENERTETKEDFEFYQKNGVVYKVITDNKYAGIYTIIKSQMNYLSGYHVIEQFLFKEFRGRNLAAAVQRKAIDSIDAEEDEFIFGTIYPHNKTSLKTALKCGRYVAGSYFTINFNSVL